MANCEDCIHFNVCDYATLQEYKTEQDLKEDCSNCILTADVVPKSEVAMEIFAEIEKKIAAALESNYNARQYFELSDDLYHVENGKISALRGIEGFIEELKKKYTNN